MILTFKEFLFETQMDTSELIDKTARSGRFENEWRTSILKKMILANDPLELKDGSKITIDKDNELVKQLLDLINSEDHIIGDEADKLKAFLNKEKCFVSTDGESYKLSSIKKSDEFGGGSKGSGGGAADTEKNESLQCIALALACSQSKDLGEEDITSENIKGVHSKFDISINYKDDDELVSMLLSDDKWKQTYISSANVLKDHFKLNKSYNFYRNNSWTKKLYDLAKDLNKQDEGPFKNMNKWNPADIWIVKGETKVPDCTSLVELNGWLQDNFTNKSVIGASLKKTSNASLKVMNSDESVASINDIDILKFSIDNENKVFSAKDAKIIFDDEKIQFRTDQKDKVVNVQGEIKGKKAAHGKIGFGNIQYILKNLKLDQLLSAQEIKDLINSKSNKKEIRFSKVLDKLVDFIHLIKPEISASTTKEQFLSNSNTDSDGWVASKLQAVQLISILQKTTERKKKDFVLHSIVFASSSSELSSVFVKVH